jgi:hypothetical protein
VISPLVRRALTWKGLKWGGLALAFLVAVRPPVLVMSHREPLPTNDISDLEFQFARGRTLLPPGSRVGWLLPPVVPGGLAKVMVVGQYSVLPDRYRQISAADCRQRGPTMCGASDLDYLVVVHAPPVSVLGDAIWLGFSVDVDIPAGIQVVGRAR